MSRTGYGSRTSPSPDLDRILVPGVVLDVFSRRIVGWAMANHLRAELILGALDMALERRRPGDVIHHSDQDCQYTPIEFGSRCHEAGVQPSMGSVGDCFDNAMCESFFATPECELLAKHRLQSQAQAIPVVFEFIEGWYNTQRRHSALDYLSPIEFEKRHARACVRVSARHDVQDAPGATIMLVLESPVH